MNKLVLVAVLLLPSLVHAQSAPPAPQVVTYPPGDDTIVVVRKGDPAPFAGQLYDDKTALRWALWLQQLKSRYAIDMQAAQDSCKVRLDHDKEVSGIEADRNKKSEADLEARLKAADAARLKAEDELRNPSFFKQNGTWFGVGIITTLVTAVVTVEVLHATK